jgi:hypothetical protein
VDTLWRSSIRLTRPIQNRRGKRRGGGHGSAAVALRTGSDLLSPALLDWTTHFLEVGVFSERIMNNSFKSSIDSVHELSREWLRSSRSSIDFSEFLRDNTGWSATCSKTSCSVSSGIPKLPKSCCEVMLVLGEIKEQYLLCPLADSSLSIRTKHACDMNTRSALVSRFQRHGRRLRSIRV